MEQLITFETAILAKQLGFDIPVQNRYRKDGGLNQDLQRRYGQPIDYNNECFQDEYRQYTSAPTQFELLRWLEEKYKILCIIKCFDEDNKGIYYWDTYADVENEDYYDDSQYEFDEYEKALEHCLLETLKDILKFKILKIK